MLLSALYRSHALSATCLARGVIGAKLDGAMTPSATSGHCWSTSVPARLVMPTTIFGLTRWRLSSRSDGQVLRVGQAEVDVGVGLPQPGDLGAELVVEPPPVHDLDDLVVLVALERRLQRDVPGRRRVREVGLVGDHHRLEVGVLLLEILYDE